jgi:hypothetical protein
VRRGVGRGPEFETGFSSLMLLALPLSVYYLRMNAGKEVCGGGAC